MTWTSTSAAALLALTLSAVACGDDSGATDDGSTGAQTSTGQETSGMATTVSNTSSASTSSTSQPGSSSSGVADETGSSESGVASGSSGTTDTDSGAACLNTPSPCPTSPGAISTELASTLLEADGAVALDVRGEGAFLTAHLPGATVLDAGDLRATVDGVGGQVASPEDAQAVFEAAGIEPTDALVVYDNANSTNPARVVWTLAYYGHTGQVWMLDGGLDQWTSEGRAVESDGGPAGGSSYAPSTEDALRVDEQWVLDHLDDPTVTLVDARSDGEFSGGHIPGAISVDWGLNLSGDGLFLAPDALRALYGDPAEEQTLVTYCQTGSRASIDWLVLTMLGYEDVRIYDGSWAEWSADPGNPVEM